MGRGDDFRLKAEEFAAKARAARDPARRAEHARMAAAYMRLAEHADRTAAANAPSANDHKPPD
jgi:hypothetical protein